MALQQRIEWFEEAAPTTSAYADDPLPSLILSELEELNRREQALPQRSAAQARKMLVSAVVGGATLWGLLIGGADLALKLIA
jgi:hypothetical protein